MEWKSFVIRDENGTELELIQHEEMIMPAKYLQMEPEKKLKLIREYKYKKDDILLCSYPKTGTHWISNLVYFLTTPGHVESMTTVPPMLMDMIPLDKWDAVEKSHVINSHLRVNRVPREHLEQDGKVIIITRDPRDTNGFPPSVKLEIAI
ncbi:sulfotransferase 1C4-like [Ruditapes philippinarum]|uniref:sulfotransferase 1C4-like n=1 Tax=Ruditapes philippinarum TaxID=129788 RepID=UPI00295B6C52|nr:sulfotransferase 1C4-like [Ruditapes philippinarum]